MKKEIIIIQMVVMLIVVGLSGCFSNNNNGEDKFVGSWTHRTIPLGRTLEFKSNGNC